MRKLSIGMLLAASMLAAPAALAQGAGPAPGWYAGAGAGINFREDSKLSGAGVGDIDFDVGPVGLLNFGYRWGYLSLEVEPSIRHNKGDTNVSNGNGTTIGLMGNVLLDFFPQSAFSVYVGLGVGGAHSNFSKLRTGGGATLLRDDDDINFAGQGIAGVRYTLNPNWTLNLSYRYFRTIDPDLKLAGGGKVEAEDRNHSVIAGFTYHFAPPPPPPPTPVAAPTPPPPPPPPAPPPAPALPEVYIVFFAFDQAQITPVAAEVLDRAIADFRRTGFAKFEVQAHTDRAGGDAYNQRLSERRANAVRAYLMQKGIQANQIDLQWFGEARPRVPTPDGVQNDQNRRAEVFLRK